MALPDTTFCLFFRSHPEAACLACDRIGVSHEELLYIPEKLFILSAPTRDVGLLQYNLRERQRQELFRRVFAARQEIIASNKVGQLWEERQQLFPEAPPPPRLKALVLQAKEQQQAMGVRDVMRRSSSGHSRNGGGVGSDSDGDGFGGGGPNDGFDTESEDDQMDELYRPKPHPPPAANSSSGNAAGRRQLTSPATSARRRPQSTPQKGQQQQQQNGQNGPSSPPETPRQLALAVFPQPPTGPPPCASRTAEVVREETRLVRVAKQRLRNYASHYVQEEKQFVDHRQQQELKMAAMRGGGSGNQQQGMMGSINNRPGTSSSSMRLTYGSDGGGGAGLRSSSSAAPNNSSNRHALSIGLVNTQNNSSSFMNGGDNTATASHRLTLPAVPDAGRTNEKQLRNLLAVTLADVVGSAGLQQKANEEAAAGAARERRGEFTLNTVRNEYADTPSPGFGVRAPLSAQGQQWARRRGDIRAKGEAEEAQRYSDYEGKWGRMQLQIEAAETEKMNPYKKLCNEAGKIRHVLALERKEGIAKAKEQSIRQQISRRSPRHQHAEDVADARRRVAERNRDAHEQLKLYRSTLKGERERMAQTKQFDVPESVKALWDAEADTLIAPSMGIAAPSGNPTNLNAVIEGAVASSTALITGEGRRSSPMSASAVHRHNNNNNTTTSATIGSKKGPAAVGRTMTMSASVSSTPRQHAIEPLAMQQHQHQLHPSSMAGGSGAAGGKGTFRPATRGSKNPYPFSSPSAVSTSPRRGSSRGGRSGSIGGSSDGGYGSSWGDPNVE